MAFSGDAPSQGHGGLEPHAACGGLCQQLSEEGAVFLIKGPASWQLSLPAVTHINLSMQGKGRIRSHSFSSHIRLASDFSLHADRFCPNVCFLILQNHQPWFYWWCACVYGILADEKSYPTWLAFSVKFPFLPFTQKKLKDAFKHTHLNRC